MDEILSNPEHDIERSHIKSVDYESRPANDANIINSQYFSYFNNLYDYKSVDIISILSPSNLSRSNIYIVDTLIEINRKI